LGNELYLEGGAT